MSDYTQNNIEVSLGRTLKRLREQINPETYIQSQIVFWHVVEDLRDTFERNNKRFDGTKFISEIMRYAGIQEMPQDAPHDDWFLQKSRGYRTEEEWRKYFGKDK